MSDQKCLTDVIDWLHGYHTQNVRLRTIFPKARAMNMPQEITEYLAILIARHCGKNIVSSKFDNDGVNMSGDAHTPPTGMKIKIKYCKNTVKCVVVPDEDTCTRVEIKNFTSSGPMSFGPDECWDTLLILDGIEYRDMKFKLYEIPYSNASPLWSTMKINKKETFLEQCQQKRRPRISFDGVRDQLGENRCHLIWEGDIRDLLKSKSYL